MLRVVWHIKDMKHTINDTIKSVGNTLSSSLYMMKLVHNADRTYIILRAIYSAIQISFTYPLIILPGNLIDELGANEKNIKLIIFLATIIVAIPLVIAVINHLFSMLLSKKQLQIKKTIEINFYKKVSSMDYETFNDPELSVIRNRSQSTLSAAVNTVDQIEQLLRAIITLIMVTTIVSRLNFFIVFLIIFMIGINSILTASYNRRHYEFKQEQQNNNKFIFSYSSVLTSEFYAKEQKVYCFGGYFLSLLNEAIEKMNLLIYNDQKTEKKANTLISFSNFIKNGIVYAYLIYQVICHGLSIGSYTIYLSAVSRFTSAFDTVANAWLSMTNSKLYINDLIDFMNSPSRQYESGRIKAPKGENLEFEFKNVSFKYPGTDNYVLHNLNLTIKDSEMLGIVGENGAGKSTIVKLLTRMYWVTEGEILLNGRSIYDYDLESYLRLFAPIFQDFALYPLSLKENIVMSDKYDEKRFTSICEKLSIDSFANKYDSAYDVPITRALYNNGIDPSGGESQKIALARAVYHNADLYIMDEPTASIDPITEYRFYEQFSELTKNKSAILITHRLSALQLVDKVAVIDNGQVVEYGTHKELYAKGGLYAKMFDKQAQFYKDN